MKRKIIYEEITSFVDGEESYITKCKLLQCEIEENPEFAFQFRVQKSVKSLLKERFCNCQAPTHASCAAIMKKISTSSDTSKKK